MVVRQRTPVGFGPGQQSGQRSASGHFQEIHVALGGLAENLRITYRENFAECEEASSVLEGACREVKLELEMQDHLMLTETQENQAEDRS